MENIENITPEESSKEAHRIDSSYTPHSIDTSNDSSNTKNTPDRWLESQLYSPEVFADHIKNLVDNTRSDEYE
jgi:hypothetical protein